MIKDIKTQFPKLLNQSLSQREISILEIPLEEEMTITQDLLNRIEKSNISSGLRIDKRITLGQLESQLRTQCPDNISQKMLFKLMNTNLSKDYSNKYHKKSQTEELIHICQHSQRHKNHRNHYLNQILKTHFSKMTQE